MSQRKEAVNRRFLAAFLALTMSFAPVYSADLSQAASVLGFGPPVIAPSAITIPGELGKIEEIFRGRSNKLVIYVQDAHANYSAQKNIASIIDHMTKEYGIDFVSAEGAEGEIDTSLFRTFPIPEITREVLDRHMKTGEIGGPEYIATVGEREIDFVGVDRHELYVKNLGEFNAVLDIRESGLEFIKKLETASRNLRNTVYSKEHKELDRIIEKYRGEAMDWMMFIKELRRFATDLSLRGAAEGGDEATFMQDYVHLSELFRLTDTLEKNGISEAGLKEKFESIDAESLFNEVERLTLHLKLKLAQSDTELHLIRLERYLFLLKRGLELTLTRDEVIELDGLAKKISRDGMMKFLKDTAAENRLRVDYLTSVETIAIDEYAQQILSFYRTTTKRDEQFLNLLKREMKSRRKQTALLVTGGFHREGVTKRLRKAGVSYAVILPHIEEISSHDKYLDIMRKQAKLFRIPSRNTLSPVLSRGESTFLIRRGETSGLFGEMWDRWDDSDMTTLRTRHRVDTEMALMERHAQGGAVAFWGQRNETGLIRMEPLPLKPYRWTAIEKGVNGPRSMSHPTLEILVDAIRAVSLNLGRPIQVADDVGEFSGSILLISPDGVAPIRGVGFGGPPRRPRMLSETQSIHDLDTGKRGTQALTEAEITYIEGLKDRIRQKAQEIGDDEMIAFLGDFDVREQVVKDWRDFLGSSGTASIDGSGIISLASEYIKYAMEIGEGMYETEENRVESEQMLMEVMIHEFRHEVDLRAGRIKGSQEPRSSEDINRGETYAIVGTAAYFDGFIHLDALENPANFSAIYNHRLPRGEVSYAYSTALSRFPESATLPYGVKYSMIKKGDADLSKADPADLELEKPFPYYLHTAEKLTRTLHGFGAVAKEFVDLAETGALELKAGKTNVEFKNRVDELLPRGEAIRTKSGERGASITQEELGQFIYDIRMLMEEFFNQSAKVKDTFVRVVTSSQPMLSAEATKRDLTKFRGDTAGLWADVLADLRTAVEKSETGFGAAQYSTKKAARAEMIRLGIKASDTLNIPIDMDRRSTRTAPVRRDQLTLADMNEMIRRERRDLKNKLDVEIKPRLSVFRDKEDTEANKQLGDAIAKIEADLLNRLTRASVDGLDKLSLRLGKQKLRSLGINQVVIEDYLGPSRGYKPRTVPFASLI